MVFKMIVFVLVMVVGLAAAQTPLCAVYPACVGGGQCCQCANGPTACTGTVNNFDICDSDCAAGATASAPSATTIHWTFYPISLSGVNTSDTYNMVINAYIHGQTSPIYTTSTQASSSWTSTITWTGAGINFPPQPYSHFTVFVANTVANTYMSYIFTYYLSGPEIATGIRSDMMAGVDIDTTPAITFPAAGMADNGVATFAFTAAPTDCANAGVSDAATCTSFCAFLNSYVLGAAGTISNNLDGSFTCTCSSSTVYGSTSPVYSCQSAAATATVPPTTSTQMATTTTMAQDIQQVASVGGGSNKGAIAGGIIGGIVFTVLCGILVTIYRRKNQVATFSSEA